jgi:hypothetical protein
MAWFGCCQVTLMDGWCNDVGMIAGLLVVAKQAYLYRF